MRIPHLNSILNLLDSLLYIERSFRCFKKHSVSLQFPRILQIQTQSLCNGRCPVCPYSALSGKQEQGVMTQELFEKIAHQAAQEPLLSELCFMLQNEPLLDRRIFQWVEYFKSLNQKTKATIVTNGEFVSEFTLKEIIQSRLDMLIISLNAYTEETFNIINKGIEYKKVIENIKLLLAQPFTRSKLVLRFLFTKINEKEINEAISFWNKKGARTQVIDIFNRAGTLENYHDYKPARARAGIFNNIKRWLWKHYECFLPFYSMSVLFNGDVILCCNDWNRAPVIGNVNQDSLRAIWNSDKMNKMRRLILERKYADITPCGGCSRVTRKIL